MEFVRGDLQELLLEMLLEMFGFLQWKQFTVFHSKCAFTAAEPNVLHGDFGDFCSSNSVPLPWEQQLIVGNRFRGKLSKKSLVALVNHL